VFNVGDKAVFPVHGVGVIETIETREIECEEISFFIFRVLGNDMKIMIPRDKIDHVGLREIIESRKIKEIYKILGRRDEITDHPSWHQRDRDYTEKIKSGSLIEIAKVLRELWMLKSVKALSSRQREMFVMAHNLLVKEISVAKDVSEEKVEEEFDRIISV